MKIFTDLRFHRDLSLLFSQIRDFRRESREREEAIMATQAEALAAIQSVADQLSTLTTDVQTLASRAEVPDAVVSAVQGLGTQVANIVALIPTS